MIGVPDRRNAITLIKEAEKNGAGRTRACQEMGITVRTLQRWTKSSSTGEDGRLHPVGKKAPANKLSEEERQEILCIANSGKYRSMPPSQIVPALADEGEYVASESTMYRVLREHNQQHHRGRGKAPQQRTVAGHCATKPNQVWSWDITWLPGPVKGLFFYLYMAIDIFSRKIVAWEIHEEESSENAKELFTRAYFSEKLMGNPLVLHSDNGSPMKGSVLLATLARLGIEPSYSRPGVSNDNPYSESLFRTLKYRPAYPYGGFATIEESRRWTYQFVNWYNTEHRHKGLKYVTPMQRHTGEAELIMARRNQVYEEARKQNPSRWSGKTRDWSLGGGVWLNQPKRKINAGISHAHNGKKTTIDSRQVA